MMANVVIGLVIRRDPGSQVKLALAAVGVTVLAVSILLPAPKSTISDPVASPNADYYPSAIPAVQAAPINREYRRL